MASTILLRDFLKKLGYENIEACNNRKTGIRIFSDLDAAGKKYGSTGFLSSTCEYKRSNGKYLTYVLTQKLFLKLQIPSLMSKLKMLLEVRLISILKNHKV